MPALVGCSVAFESRGSIFLLTARHVVVDLGMNDFHVYTPEGWILANGQIARTDPVGRRDDRLDAAVIRLDHACINDYVSEHALSIDDLDVAMPVNPPGSLMQLVGYPGGGVLDMGDRTLSPTWFQWAGVSAEERDFQKRGKKTDRHSIFHFDRATAIHIEKGRHPGPDMSGASGSGMWRMLPIGEDGIAERWTLLSAIFTEYSGRTIIGTRVGIHLALIARYFPEAVPK